MGCINSKPVPPPPRPIQPLTQEREKRLKDLGTGVGDALAFIISNLPMPGAGAAALGVRLGAQLLIKESLKAYSKFQFRQNLKAVKAHLLAPNTSSVEQLVDDLVYAKVWKPEYRKEILKALAAWEAKNPHKEEEEVKDVLLDDISNIEGMENSEERDKETLMSDEEVKQVENAIEEGRKKRQMKCGKCGVVGVNRRSHFNEAATNYNKHDHTNDTAAEVEAAAAEKKAAAARKEVQAAAEEAAATAAAVAAEAEAPILGLPNMEAQIMVAGNMVARCQSVVANGNNRGSQCGAPASRGDRCGRHRL